MNESNNCACPGTGNESSVDVTVENQTRKCKSVVQKENEK